jgi:hypothetical protein
MPPIIKRPRQVTIFILLCFLISFWYGVRLVEGILFWETFRIYGINPLYIAFSGGLWFITGLVVGVGVWRGKAWSWVASLFSSASFVIWYWFDRLVFESLRNDWPFALGVTICCILIVVLILFSRSSRIFFLKKCVL